MATSKKPRKKHNKNERLIKFADKQADRTFALFIHGLGDEGIEWVLNGDADRAAESNHDIVSMWKEPKQDTVTVNLPCPLKEPKDGMWSVNECGPIESFYRGKDMNLSIFNKRVYFSSKEDAQAWFDAMKYNRR